MSRSIVYIADSLNTLDESLQLKLLVSELARSDDWNVHVAVITPSSDESNTLAEIDVKIHRLSEAAGLSNRSGGVVATLLAAPALKRVLSSIKPNVVHTWGLSAHRCLGAAREIEKSSDSNPKWISTFTRKPEKSGVVVRAWDRRVCKQVEKVFVAHGSQKPSVLEMGFSDGQIAVAPNAAVVLPDRESTRAKLLERIGLSGTTSIVAGTVADLVPATRMKDLIWATDLLNCIRDDFHLVIFGDGHQRQNLDRFAGFTEAQSHVHFLPPEEAEGLLGALDVYWHSHLVHPLASPLLCAMASGVPVISVFGDGTQEVILHQQTGMAVNYGARDEFARWTKFLIEKPDAARQLADQGKAHVLEKFPLEEMLGRYRCEF